MQACKTLTESHGCQNVVMTLGERGVVYQGGKGEEPIHIPTQQVKAVDTTVKALVLTMSIKSHCLEINSLSNKHNAELRRIAWGANVSCLKL